MTDLEYYARRLADERAMEERAPEPIVRARHRTLARLYEERLRRLKEQHLEHEPQQLGLV